MKGVDPPLAGELDLTRENLTEGEWEPLLEVRKAVAGGRFAYQVRMRGKEAFATLLPNDRLDFHYSVTDRCAKVPAPKRRRWGRRR